ncbi:hypothetical protein SAMN03159338_3694 [Sphingomonas sp. NFR04]|uniref:hypothetical protein n=1 Tax=Sphingomonas sp. NFR04 TaxID=1566283 RepID=UPI0008E0DD64|nr:hypothetical protein [Sphingomonas sp. NFR04]SFK25237.1 hypothetical protein SAMN03159338_3694 [Sphingomonas sp. NFR04]
MLPWAVAAAIVLAIPLLVRWGLGRTRGKAGAAALMLGLAFGHLFDPARAEATESLQKRREQGEAAGEEAGAPPLGTSPKHLSE